MNKRMLAYFLTVAAIVALTLLLVVLIMNPPVGDLIELGRLLSITAVFSAVVGYASHRLGWWRQFRSLTSALVVSYLIAAGLTLVNVWLTARLMFINDHDLALATLLLLFASAISVSFGAFMVASSTEALRKLVRGTEQLSEGDFSTRVAVDGRDEIGQLSQTFNHMVSRLEQAAASERAIEETRRDLVAWASHDLRTPLASLRAMIDALAEGIVDDPETITRYLQQSQHEIDRMSRMINDLFELAQLDAGGIIPAYEAASLSDLISDTLVSFAENARFAGITLEGASGPGVDPVHMAPDKIGRVLTNLVENALHHTPAGGKVCVEALLDGDDVQVVVSDDGPGIAAHDRDRIFESFYRGEPSRSRDGYAQGGTGLGLAIARAIVEAHGGRIWLDGETASGATFRFVLPRASRTA